MILILSESRDFSTFVVIEWLIHLKKDFIRLNYDTDKIKDIQIAEQAEFPEASIIIALSDGRSFNIDQITSYWYRRGGLPMYVEAGEVNQEIKNIFKHGVVSNRIKIHLHHELRVVFDYIYQCLDLKKIKIGSSSRASVNKLSVNLFARKCGLITPESLISTNGLALKVFSEEHPIAITKSLSDGLSIQGIKHGWTTYTENIKDKHLTVYKHAIFPSLVQQGIVKKYELRIFYLLGEVYPMCIFSQSNTQTQIDFRKYDFYKPNRTVPYILPGAIKQKLVELMKLLRLETGSIDMIVDKSDNYIFLEVNPVGQFGMVSEPCNYELEKTIASYLN